MPAKKATSRTRKHRELSFKEIDYTVSYAPRKVTCSDDLNAASNIIGQQRALDAIKVGLNVPSRGYNIFVTGLPGTGRTTTISHLLHQLKRNDPELFDICYVNNFKNVDSPKILKFPAGDGRRFRKDMEYLISNTRKVVPKIYLADDYKDRHDRLVREFENRQKELIGKFEASLTRAGFVMVQIQTQMGTRNEIQPLVDEEPVGLEAIERLVKEGKFSEAKLDELRRAWDSLRREFDVTTIESKKLSAKLEEAVDKLNYSMIAPLISDKINLLKKRYPDPKVISYLEAVEEALLSDLDRYREAQPRRGEQEAPPYRKQEPFEEFSVNLILDNADTTEIPVITEKSPSYKNLFGSLERVVDRFGYWRTDFTRIFSGSLLKASGGYLVMNALDVLTEAGVWQALKRALRNGEMEITGFDPFYMMAGSGIKPEQIPLNVKVVLIGDARIYHMLWNWDEDFKKIFKIKSEFDTSMPLKNSTVNQYYCFVKRIVDEENLRTFDISALQAIAEFGRKLSGHRKKISLRFTIVADVVREAAYCARERRAKRVLRKDVEQAIVNRRYRVNLVESKIQEMIDNDVLMVSTSGKVIGQINGLAVYNYGEYQFGRPSKITANVSLGKSGVINIERDADMSGPIHNKGVGILSGFLRDSFAQDKPLSMTASISFEQSYSGVDGDSASSTEIYAILSALTRLPIKQGIAVTGSVNQKGEIQPIGGVNEKIEGFYDVCKNKRLTGSQGVMIPHQNVQDLLLRPDVNEAIKSGKFHVYPVKTISEGIEILTGTPGGKRLASRKFSPGSVMAKADDKLLEMALAYDRFARDNNTNKRKRPARARNRRKK